MGCIFFIKKTHVSYHSHSRSFIPMNHATADDDVAAAADAPYNETNILVVAAVNPTPEARSPPPETCCPQCFVGTVIVVLAIYSFVITGVLNEIKAETHDWAGRYREASRELTECRHAGYKRCGEHTKWLEDEYETCRQTAIERDRARHDLDRCETQERGEYQQRFIDCIIRWGYRQSTPRNPIDGDWCSLPCQMATCS